MTDFDQDKMTEYVKREIKNEVESLTNDQFGEAYDDIHGFAESFSDAIDRYSVEEAVLVQFNFPDDGSGVPFVAAMADSILESDWFYDYIIGERDSRLGEIEKRKTDQRAYYAEITRHTT